MRFKVSGANGKKRGYSLNWFDIGHVFFSVPRAIEASPIMRLRFFKEGIAMKPPEMIDAFTDTIWRKFEELFALWKGGEFYVPLHPDPEAGWAFRRVVVDDALKTDADSRSLTEPVAGPSTASRHNSLATPASEATKRKRVQEGNHQDEVTASPAPAKRRISLSDQSNRPSK